MLTLLAGLAAGILHVLTGPDHLATVGTLAVEERRRSWVTGLVWGVGHTSLVYLGGFGLGTIAAMAGFSWVMGGVAQRLVGVGLQAHRLLVTGCAAAAITIGCVWLADAGSSPWVAMGIVGVLAYGLPWPVARPLLYRNKSAAPSGQAREMVPPSAKALLQAGLLVLDPVGHQVQVEGRRLELTTTEFKLLVYLVEHPGQVLSRDDLLRSVWGYATSGYSRTVDTHVQRLREKLGQASCLIETVRGAGYRFRAGDA